MSLWYLASPYSHDSEAIREDRFKAACRAAGELMQNGWYVFSPIAHTHPIAVMCDLPKGFDFWEPYDAMMMDACDACIVLCIDGYRESKGVQAEIAYFREQGKPVQWLQESPTGVLKLGFVESRRVQSEVED